MFSGIAIRINSSDISLIIANIVTIVYAYRFHWQIGDLLLVYWLQSIIIGIFQIIKILGVKNSNAEGFIGDDSHPRPTTDKDKRQLALYFAVSYGLFHLAYFLFLFSSFRDLKGSLILGGVFLLNHLFSFFINWRKDSLRRQNLAYIFLQPYARIIPMHFFILFGVFFAWIPIIYFQVLKTAADIISHNIEHNYGPVVQINPSQPA